MRRRTYSNNDSYYEDTAGIQHRFSLRNTPITNFCVTASSMTIKGINVSKNNIKNIVFGESYRNINALNTNFLRNLPQLISVDLSVFTNVASIGTDFMIAATQLTSVDLSPFANVVSIGSSFLSACGITSIDLSPFANVTSIGSYLLFGCLGLISVDLSPLISVTSIQTDLIFNSDNILLLNIGNIPATVFAHNDRVCSTDNILAPSYVTGITVTGVDAAAFIQRFPNRNIDPYRNLINATTYAYELYPAGGTVTGGTPSGSYPAGATITLPASATRSGYTFAGFVSGAFPGVTYGLGDTFVMPAGNLTVNAVWTANNPLTIYVQNTSLLFFAFVSVAPYPGSFRWEDANTYTIAPGDTIPISNDKDGGEFIAGSSYTIYWKLEDNTNGTVFISDMQDGSNYQVG
ncbi:InlB B-repeat-containing protein [Dysgonomonas termitidis]